MENDWKLGHSERLSYLNADLHDLMDFQKFSRPPGNVLCDFAILLSLISAIMDQLSMLKGQNVLCPGTQWIKDHDVDSLEGKGNWASIEEF